MRMRESAWATVFLTQNCWMRFLNWVQRNLRETHSGLPLTWVSRDSFKIICFSPCLPLKCCRGILYAIIDVKKRQVILVTNGFSHSSSREQTGEESNSPGLSCYGENSYFLCVQPFRNSQTIIDRSYGPCDLNCRHFNPSGASSAHDKQIHGGIWLDRC